MKIQLTWTPRPWWRGKYAGWHVPCGKPRRRWLRVLWVGVIVGCLGALPLLAAQPKPKRAMFQATATPQHAVTLTWTASPTAGVTYTVERSTAGCGSSATFTVLAQNVATTTYSDATAAVGTDYGYEVYAVSALGVDSTVPTNCADVNLTPPAAPTNLLTQVLEAVVHFFGRIFRWA